MGDEAFALNKMSGLSFLFSSLLLKSEGHGHTLVSNHECEKLNQSSVENENRLIVFFIPLKYLSKPPFS